MTPSETIQLVSVCGTIALGSLALIATILKMVLDYRERRSHFRQATYSKQVEAFADLNLCARNLFFHLHQNVGKPMGAAAQKEFACETGQLCMSFQHSNNKWFLFLPISVVKRVTDYLGAVDAVLQTLAGQTNAIASQHDALEQAFYQLVNAMRFSLGVDFLSDEVSGIVGSRALVAYHERTSDLQRLASEKLNATPS